MLERLICDNCAQAFFELGKLFQREGLLCPVCKQFHYFTAERDITWHSRYYGMKFGETDRSLFPMIAYQHLVMLKKRRATKNDLHS